MGKPKTLLCSRCRQAFSPNELRNLCTCGAPLLVEYDLDAVRRTWSRDGIDPVASMWRYHPVLPAALDEAVTLGEGWTPLIRMPSLGRNVWV